jgi:hypothetical protein
MSCDTNRCHSSCRAWISLLLALSVAFSARAEEAASEPEAVLTLDVDSFDDAVAKHPFVLFGRILWSAGGIASALVLLSPCPSLSSSAVQGRQYFGAGWRVLLLLDAGTAKGQKP